MKCSECLYFLRYETHSPYKVRYGTCSYLVNWPKVPKVYRLIRQGKRMAVEFPVAERIVHQDDGGECETYEKMQNIDGEIND